MSRPLPAAVQQTLTQGETSFICVHCGRAVPLPEGKGTRNRNHCPACLWSRHLDIKPGDRRSGCKAPMEPVAIWCRPGGEWALIHRCTVCGMLKANRIAGDDSEFALLQIAAMALTQPPFPITAGLVPSPSGEGLSSVHREEGLSSAHQGEDTLKGAPHADTIFSPQLGLDQSARNSI